MAQLTLDNIPKELLDQIRQRAEKEQISFQEKVIHLLHQALKSPPSFAKSLHQFRQSFPECDSEDAEAFEGTRAKDMGREINL